MAACTWWGSTEWFRARLIFHGRALRPPARNEGTLALLAKHGWSDRENSLCPFHMTSLVPPPSPAPSGPPHPWCPLVLGQIESNSPNRMVERIRELKELEDECPLFKSTENSVQNTKMSNLWKCGSLSRDLEFPHHISRFLKHKVRTRNHSIQLLLWSKVVTWPFTPLQPPRAPYLKHQSILNSFRMSSFICWNLPFWNSSPLARFCFV